MIYHENRGGLEFVAWKDKSNAKETGRNEEVKKKKKNGTRVNEQSSQRCQRGRRA